MSRYEKLAWRFSIIYVGVLLLSGLQNLGNFYFSLVTQLLLLGIFYMAFRKRRLVFSSLGFAWLLFGSLKAVYSLRTLMLLYSEKDGFAVLMAGAIVGLTFTLLTTYFALRAFLGQMVERRSAGV